MNSNSTLLYLRNQINTASGEKIVAMLLDRCIGCIKVAIAAINNHNPEMRYNNLDKAIEIISYLSSAVDVDNGGEVAKNLFQIYRFCMDRLAQADLHNSCAAAEQILEILEPIRYAYKELSSTQREEGKGMAEVTVLPVKRKK